MRLPETLCIALWSFLSLNLLHNLFCVHPEVCIIIIIILQIRGKLCYNSWADRARQNQQPRTKRTTNQVTQVRRVPDVLDAIGKFCSFFPPTRILMTLHDRFTIRQITHIPAAVVEIDFYNFTLIFCLGWLHYRAKFRHHVPGYRTQWRTITYSEALMLWKKKDNLWTGNQNQCMDAPRLPWQSGS